MLSQVVPMVGAQPVPDYVPQVVAVQFEMTPFIQHKSRAGLQDFDRIAASYGATR